MQRRKTIQIPTKQQIDKMYAAGDIEGLRALNERLAKTANQRMSQLYKSGYETEALKRAKYYTQQELNVATGGVFSRSKKLDPETLKEQLTQEIMFLNSAGSTVSGEKRRRAEKAYTTLTAPRVDAQGNSLKPYLEIPEEIKVPADWQGLENEYFKEKFFKFLETDAWKDIKKYIYTDNSNILAEAGEAISRGAKLEDLRKEYKAYLLGEVDIYEAWENWVSI